MPGVRISGRQFFPCEGIRQSEQKLDVRFTVTVRKRIIISECISTTQVYDAEIVDDVFVYS